MRVSTYIRLYTLLILFQWSLLATASPIKLLLLGLCLFNQGFNCIEVRFLKDLFYIFCCNLSWDEEYCSF